jgi:beta-N-acetylhexosaminidase
MKSFFSVLLSLCFFISSTVNATPKVSLRDKIGQMLLIGFDGKKVDSLSPVVKTIENVEVQT